jgi:hypothetical protein
MEDLGDGPRRDAAKTRLRDVLGPGRTVIDHTYDFGDNWEVRLTAAKVRQGEASQSYPYLVRGEWAAPPEDRGGIPGFYELLDILADPERADDDGLREHFEGYDPNQVDIFIMNIALSRIARRRRAAQITAAKKKARPAKDP